MERGILIIGYLIVLGSFFICTQHCEGSNEIRFNKIEYLLKREGVEITRDVGIYKGMELYDYINGGADIYFEYGFKHAKEIHAKYKESEFEISIYDMGDNAGAFGILTYSQYDGMKALRGVINGRMSSSKAIFCVSRYFVMIQSQSFENEVSDEIIYITGILNKLKEKEDFKVNLSKHLPEKDRINYSEKIIVGEIGLSSLVYYISDLVKLSKKAPGYYGRYSFQGNEAKLLVIQMSKNDSKSAVKKISEKLIGKYNKIEDVGSRTCYISSKGLYNLVYYENGKLILIFDGKEKNSVKSLIKSLSKLN